MKNSISSVLVVLSLIIGACTEQNNASEQNKSLIIKTNDELFNKGNLSVADEVFSNDYAGRGPEFIKEFAKDLRTAFPDIQVTIDPIIAEGDMTAWRRTHTGTHKGEYIGFQPTGKKITWQTTIFSRYDEDGRIVEEWVVSDLFEVLQNVIIEEPEEE